MRVFKVSFYLRMPDGATLDQNTAAKEVKRLIQEGGRADAIEYLGERPAEPTKPSSSARFPKEGRVR